jgi:hypothetical protein
VASPSASNPIPYFSSLLDKERICSKIFTMHILPARHFLEVTACQGDFWESATKTPAKAHHWSAGRQACMQAHSLRYVICNRSGQVVTSGGATSQ